MSTTSHEGLDSTVMLGLSIVGSHPAQVNNGEEVNTPEILDSIVSMNPTSNYNNDYFQRMSRNQTFSFPTSYSSLDVIAYEYCKWSK